MQNVKTYRARNDYFQLNNFGDEYVREFEGELISFKENIHISGFPTGNIVALNTNDGIVELVLPLDRKTAVKSSKIIRQNASEGCKMKLKAVTGKTSNPQIWINGKCLSERIMILSKFPEMQSFQTTYPELYNAISKGIKELIVKNQIDVISVIQENETLLSQFSKDAKTTLLTALIQNEIKTSK